MDTRRIVLKETAIIGLGELVCSAVMVGIFAAVGQFSLSVLLSALTGCAVITANYFLMAVAVSNAANRAEGGEVERAKQSVQLSSLVRLVCMGVVLFVAIRLGANVIALLLPLLFMRPVVMVTAFFRKKGD